MTVHITPSDLKLLDAEPRVHDLRLADALEFSQSRDIRKLIDRNRAELGKHGEVCATVAQTSPSGGRPTNEYWLNEPQSLLVCMFSRTERAAEVRAEIIKVFMVWRRGQTTAPIVGMVAGAPWDFPTEPGLLEACRVKLAMVDQARRVHGIHAARAVWNTLGLPPVPGFEPIRSDEAQRCLAHLLGQMLIDGDSRTLGQWIALALDLDTDSEARKGLKNEGIIVIDDGDAELGFVLANSHVRVARMFSGTPWRETYPYVLRRLPGAGPHKRMHYGMMQCRGTFVPATLLEPPASAPPANVVPLRQ